jgi:hypothetical protein
MFWAAGYRQRRYTYSLMKIYSVTVFLFIVLSFEKSICSFNEIKCQIKSLLDLDIYFTGFV